MNKHNYTHKFENASRNKQIFGILNEWDFKKVSIFFILIFLPNLLSLININTTLGFKIHFFQLGIIIASLAYGPFGGLISGMIGSIYPAMITSNPYIIIGNMILGFVAGYLIRLKWNIIVATLTAFMIQMPWLILSDYYFMGLSTTFIIGLIIALAISNTIWATLAYYSRNQIAKIV